MLHLHSLKTGGGSESLRSWAECKRVCVPASERTAWVACVGRFVVCRLWRSFPEFFAVWSLILKEGRHSVIRRLSISSLPIMQCFPIHDRVQALSFSRRHTSKFHLVLLCFLSINVFIMTMIAVRGSLLSKCFVIYICFGPQLHIHAVSSLVGLPGQLTQLWSCCLLSSLHLQSHYPSHVLFIASHDVY